MARKSTTGWDTQSKSNRVKFKEAVERGLAEQQLSKQEFASRIGVSPTWVSNFLKTFVEPDPKSGLAVRPSKEVTHSIALVLGSDILQWAPPAMRGSGASQNDSQPKQSLEVQYELGTALLWAARADLLARISFEEEAPRQVAELGRRIHQDLVLSAQEHPIGRHLVDDAGRLRSISELSQDVRPIIKHMVISELLHMRLFAPFEQSIDWKLKLRLVTSIGKDMGVPVKSIEAITKLFGGKGPQTNSEILKRDSVAGAFGRMYFPENDRRSVLIGHDPVGWFGFPYVSGLWLMRGFTLNSFVEQDRPSPQISRQSSKSSQLAKSVGALTASVFLGPIAGVIVATSAMLSWRDQQPSSGVTENQQNENTDVAQGIAKTAIAFGPAWSHIELLKTQTFYVSIGQDPKGKLDLKYFQLPTEAMAAKRIPEVLAELETRRNELRKSTALQDSPSEKDLSQLIEYTSAYLKMLKTAGFTIPVTHTRA